jgi:hypothetical protein
VDQVVDPDPELMGVAVIPNQKLMHERPACRRSDVGLGLLETDDPVPVLPLKALFQEVYAFEPLQDVALNDDSA